MLSLSLVKCKLAYQLATRLALNISGNILATSHAITTSSAVPVATATYVGFNCDRLKNKTAQRKGNVRVIECFSTTEKSTSITWLARSCRVFPTTRRPATSTTRSTSYSTTRTPRRNASSSSMPTSCPGSSFFSPCSLAEFKLKPTELFLNLAVKQ